MLTERDHQPCGENFAHTVEGSSLAQNSIRSSEIPKGENTLKEVSGNPNSLANREGDTGTVFERAHGAETEPQKPKRPSVAERNNPSPQYSREDDNAVDRREEQGKREIVIENEEVEHRPGLAREMSRSELLSDEGDNKIRLEERANDESAGNPLPNGLKERGENWFKAGFANRSVRSSYITAVGEFVTGTGVVIFQRGSLAELEAITAPAIALFAITLMYHYRVRKTL